MPAATKRTLIAVLAAAAGLAILAVTPTAFAEIPPLQAADARIVAAERNAVDTSIRPADSRTQALVDADPAELNAFSADGGTPIRAFTAETDMARREVRHQAGRRAKRGARRRARRRH